MRAEFRETVRRGTRRPRRRRVRRARKTLTCPCARQDVSALRPRAVAKLMFMHMLGYPTHFGQMECLKLLSSTSYAEKVCSVAGECGACADAATAARSAWATWASRCCWMSARRC